ncbi:MAG: (Na+)-NQR maturation NqrM [Pseudomonadales bacterium]|nr:(Na+)-NQR maturation NqrM [Pseudomonadales bacterium]MCP5331592.1 (Na+)-NQR maturation NqrM [Pseudomonadales bacterium]MCP5344777.1 (Na+)-NQR maturation NqrM [Pseudomonadales bacterium]
MTTLVASFIILALVVAGMAVGVMFGRKPIKGTCGGLNNGSGDSSCSLCGGNPDKCEETSR